MSQQPFSRPGAVDLSALKNAAPASAASGAGARGQAGSGAYAVDVDEQNVQSVLESSMTAPVLLVIYSPSKSPASAQLAVDLATLADEFDGRFLLGRVDVDAQPTLAQMLQIPSVPLTAIVLQGRLQPLFQDAPQIDQLRGELNAMFQQLTTQGVTGRHQPQPGAQPVAEGEPEQQEYVDPRYAPAEDALAAGDLDRAVAEYQKLVDANPADAEAAGGLAMATVLARTKDVDAVAARTAAADSPDDVDAQTLVADLDLIGGHVEDAFSRLVDLVRRTSEGDRDKARTHLLGLFAAVGSDDERVAKARRALTSALF